MSRKVKNILFIMFDQLRWDYLSCYGHPHLKTPHMDKLASQGVRFSRAYVQSTICGSSRMSYYTGRYVHSHGAQRNNFPLKVGELTLGDHLRDNGMDAFLVGKTHMQVDSAGLERLGIAPDSVIGARISECGFDRVIREDGLRAEGKDGSYDGVASPYNDYLKEQGYDAPNPWHVNANAGLDEDGNLASGWLMTNANLPANIKEEHSETPWLTGEAIKFLEDRKKQSRPWLCHLSYIKPHWPYIAPAPYNDMFGPEHVIPVAADDKEKINPHPLFAAYHDSLIARSFSRKEVRDKVIPAYMGLIKQCDDQLGRLFKYLEDSGQMDSTMIVISSDHGDYMGDHWLGEKELFHECSVKVPLIIYDPSSEADSSRGTVCDELVEAIDLTSTFLAATGAKIPEHIVEGRSLLPFLRGKKPEQWRDFAISEYDFSSNPVAVTLGLEPRDCRIFMVADKRWKFMHCEGGLPPALFDLENDPSEYTNLGENPDYQKIIDMMYERLGRWARRMSQRTALSDETIKASRGKGRGKGILLGLYDGSELDEEYLSAIGGRAKSAR